MQMVGEQRLGKKTKKINIAEKYKGQDVVESCVRLRPEGTKGIENEKKKKMKLSKVIFTIKLIFKYISVWKRVASSVCLRPDNA